MAVKPTGRSVVAAAAVRGDGVFVYVLRCSGDGSRLQEPLPHLLRVLCSGDKACEADAMMRGWQSGGKQGNGTTLTT